MKSYITYSEDETKKLAKSLAKKFESGVIALIGELGAGKTTFAAGFAQGLGIKEKIISPTFILIRQHQIPHSKKNLPAGPLSRSSSEASRQVLYHIDLYRLEQLKDIKHLGIEEIIRNPNNIVLIEWAEKLKGLPKGTMKISIQKESTNKRRFIVLF